MKRIVLGLLAATAMSASAFADEIAPALIYDLGGKFDKSFNEAAYNGAERFKEETPELGSTLWAAYNALTHYSTHLPNIQARNSNRELVATRRADEVRTVIESDFWRGLEREAA